MGQTCYESEKYEQLSISDCKNIDSNAVAFTIKKQKDWDHNQHKEISIDVISCGYNGSMATTKSDCLDSCTRSDDLGQRKMGMPCHMMTLNLIHVDMIQWRFANIPNMSGHIGMIGQMERRLAMVCRKAKVLQI